MKELPIHTYFFETVVTKKIIFRYFPGFVLRNALMHAMEELYCARYAASRQKPGGCEKCPWLSNCIYHELNLPVCDIPDKVVQPYLISTEGINTNDIFPQGTRFCFQLSLFGYTNRYAKEWIEAVRYLGSRMGMGPDSGRFELQQVKPVMNYTTKYKANNRTSVELFFPYLYFFRQRNKIPPEGISFRQLITKIYSRYTLLSMQYCEADSKLGYEQTKLEMPQLVESCFHISRLFYPPGGSIRHYDCFKGAVIYTGNMEPFEELLKFGSQAGIGQYTSAGLGKFRINYTNYQGIVTH